MIVDDDPVVRRMLQLTFEAEGFEVVTAADGVEALAAVRGERPAILVLDIMMPKLDGMKVMRELKADDDLRNIPVILLSAKGRNVDQKIGFEVGADDYITKPFSPRKLVERINAILGQTSPNRMQA